MNHITALNLGRTRFADAWKLQGSLLDARRAGLSGDLLLYTEHEHVYTVGKGGDENHLLASGAELRRDNIDLFRIDRGGDVTYHGPGQIVGYPILDLHSYKEDLHWYLRSLEEAIIRALRDFSIEAGREEGMTGVWVRGEKIAAIGIKISRWVTMHGFALNVNTDLTKFGRIIPCGIFHKGVTSMERLLGGPVELPKVHQSLNRALETVLGCSIEWGTESALSVADEQPEFERV